MIRGHVDRPCVGLFEGGDARREVIEAAGQRDSVTSGL
jgi:hypothetical protein